MSLDILKKRIKDNNISGVYLFCGPEEYTKDYYASRIRKKIDSSPLPEFNHIYFCASSDKLYDLKDAVYSLPYMSDTKLIEITDLENAKLTEADIEDYAEVFSEIPDYIIILAVLRSDEQTENARSAKSNSSGLNAFISTVKDHGLVVEFETEKADKLVSWINKHFASNGVTFEPNVPREIINVCGSDMYILGGEILKLCEIFSGKPLTASDVHKYCCANIAYKYFDITAALNRRDIVTAKRIWENLDLPREEIPMALGFLAKHYSEMLLVKTALDNGKGYDTIAKDLKIPSWKVGKIASAAACADIKQISFAISQLANADMKIKTYRGNASRILEVVFYRICTYGRKA